MFQREGGFILLAICKSMDQDYNGRDGWKDREGDGIAHLGFCCCCATPVDQGRRMGDHCCVLVPSSCSHMGALRCDGESYLTAPGIVAPGTTGVAQAESEVGWPRWWEGTN